MARLHLSRNFQASYLSAAMAVMLTACLLGCSPQPDSAGAENPFDSRVLPKDAKTRDGSEDKCGEDKCGSID